MCRIFYNPSDLITFKNNDIWKFLLHLEKLQGRDGNGIYNFSDKTLYRSMDMPIDANVKGSFLFHTRFATHGKKAVYNVQPFVGDRYIMVHNGVFLHIGGFAHMLGFPTFTGNKYSDSYMMHWIMERVGLFHFYMTFIDKSYGVVVVYDRKLKQSFLLKTGGSFQYAKLKSGKYIYASTALDNWQLDGKPIDFGSGLWRIGENGIEQLHKIIPTYYTYQYTRRHISYYDNKEWDRTKQEWIVKKKKPSHKVKHTCPYCWQVVPQNEETYNDEGFHICMACKKRYVNTDKDDIPTGIESLFKTQIPKSCIGCIYVDYQENICLYGSEEFACAVQDGKGLCWTGKPTVPQYCNGCNWLCETDCWFGGVKQKTFCLNMVGKNGISECNTRAKDTLKIVIMCDVCRATLKSKSSWGIYHDKIMCKTCMDDVIQCETYGQETEPIPKDCALCHFENSSSKQEPCLSCLDTVIDGELINWTEKPNEAETRCHICGYYFSFDDEPIYDDNKNRICLGCDSYGDYMANYGEY